MTDTLTILGSTGRDKAGTLETFECPGRIDHVQFKTREFTAMCPITGGPDLYDLTLTYFPLSLCLEAKSLKLYLETFRNQGKFAEALACEIAEAIQKVTHGYSTRVVLKQHVRGGLTLEVECERYGDDDAGN